MKELYRTPKPVAISTAVILGISGLTGACARAEKGDTDAAAAATASAATSSTSRGSLSEKPGRPYPWPYCDNAPEHRAPSVGFSKDGPIALIDSNCTDPRDPYTGLYDANGQASQANGIPRGRLRNGSEAVVLCWLTGQMIANDTGVGTTRWNEIIPTPGQEMLMPDGSQIQTTGNQQFLVPNTHLAFFDSPGVTHC